MEGRSRNHDKKRRNERYFGGKLNEESTNFRPSIFHDFIIAEDLSPSKENRLSFHKEDYYFNL